MSFEARVARLPAMAGRIVVVPGPVAVIRIEHPTARNALTPGMMVGLRHAAVEVHGAAAVVLHGEGDFCSGGDLGAVAEHLLSSEAAAEMQAYMAETCAMLADAGTLVIAAVEGVALGGGAELLTACDLVVASPRARIGFIQAVMGVSPGFGGAARLVARIGALRALDVLTRAKPMTADEAERVGLVDQVSDDVLGWALARGAEVAALPVQARSAVKPLIRSVLAGDSLEAQTFAGLWGGPEHVAALHRFRTR